MALPGIAPSISLEPLSLPAIVVEIRWGKRGADPNGIDKGHPQKGPDGPGGSTKPHARLLLASRIVSRSRWHRHFFCRDGNIIRSIPGEVNVLPNASIVIGILPCLNLESKKRV